MHYLVVKSCMGLKAKLMQARCNISTIYWVLRKKLVFVLLHLSVHRLKPFNFATQYYSGTTFYLSFSTVCRKAGGGGRWIRSYSIPFNESRVLTLQKWEINVKIFFLSRIFNELSTSCYNDFYDEGMRRIQYWFFTNANLTRVRSARKME